MTIRPRIAALLLLGLFVLAACTPVAAVAPTPSPLPPPTATLQPSPTPVPVFASGSRLAGVDVGGLTLDAAREQLVTQLTAPTPITLRAGDVRVSLDPATLGLTPNIDDLLAEADAGLGSDQPVEVVRTGDLDTDALRQQLDDLAEEVSVPAAIHVISETKTISRSFGYTPGMILDVDAALSEVTRQLDKDELPTTITLDLITDPNPPRVDAERLLAEVEAMAEEWDGVIGFYLYDPATGEEVRFHDKTVFAGASTIKVAIMLNAYIHLEEFTEKQEFWFGEMIKYSDNISANHLLSAAAGGVGTEIAFTGAEQMSAMLADDLGLENLYLYIPYEAIDFIRQNNINYKRGPKDPVGEPPYTETGATLRATPYSIAQVYKAIDACANGEGVLLEKFDLLTPERCQEMLDRLATNADKTRMVAGVPRGTRVEHKSGWIEDMQADAGIVRSPAGDYVLAVYVYKKLTGDAYMWPDEMMAPVVAAFSRLAYSAYNPILLDPDTLAPEE